MLTTFSSAALLRVESAKEEVAILGACVGRACPATFAIHLKQLREATRVLDACRAEASAEAEVRPDPQQIATLIAEGGPAHEREAA